MCMLMAACGTKLDVQENTIALQRNGKILEAAVETFDQSYYKEDELNSYIQNAVDDYTAEHGKKVGVCDGVKGRGEKSISYASI